MVPLQLHKCILGCILSTALTTATLTYTRPAQPDNDKILKIQQSVNETSRLIPGGSPFYYLEEPTNDVLKIDEISMTPNPLFIGITGIISTTITLTRNITALTVDFLIQAKQDGQWWKIIGDNDTLCQYATVTQDGKKLDRKGACDVKKGAATIELELPLVHGYVVEGYYFFDIQLKSREEQLVRVGAVMEFKEPDSSDSGSDSDRLGRYYLNSASSAARQQPQTS